jgi:hypothetical protein
MIMEIPMGIDGNIGIMEKQFGIPNLSIGVSQVQLPGPKGLDFSTQEHNANLKLVENLIVETSLAIIGYDFDTHDISCQTPTLFQRPKIGDQIAALLGVTDPLKQHFGSWNERLGFGQISIKVLG